MIHSSDDASFSRFGEVTASVRVSVCKITIVRVLAYLERPQHGPEDPKRCCDCVVVHPMYTLDIQIDDDWRLECDTADEGF